MPHDLLQQLIALGVEYLVVGDKSGNVRVTIDSGRTFIGPATEAIPEAIRAHQDRLTGYAGDVATR